MSRSIAFIINPVSGIHHDKKTKLIKLLEQQAADKHIDYQLFFTEYAGHAFLIATEAIKQGFDTVVAVGGDGSVNEVAKALAGTTINLGIIPLGSGNGLARFLEIPFNLQQALDTLLNAKVLKMDTILINHSIRMVSIAGLGFDARVARLFAKESRRGFFTYFKIALKQYLAYNPKKYSITIGQDHLEVQALFISIANSNQFGYNTTIAPQADITDGLADIVIVSKVPYYKTPLVAGLLFSKKIDHSKYVTTLKAEEFTIVRKKGKFINIDGEPIKVRKDLHFKVDKHSLNILVP
jgi:YegS/Rv2252/BmrU family lipid kinase